MNFQKFSNLRVNDNESLSRLPVHLAESAKSDTIHDGSSIPVMCTVEAWIMLAGLMESIVGSLESICLFNILYYFRGVLLFRRLECKMGMHHLCISLCCYIQHSTFNNSTFKCLNWNADPNRQWLIAGICIIVVEWATHMQMDGGSSPSRVNKIEKLI